MVVKNMSSEVSIDLSLLKERYYADPHGVLRELRQEKPVHRVRLPNDELAWLVVGRAEIRAALAETSLSSDVGRRLGAPEQQQGGSSILGMLTCDDPRHRELRSLVAGAFTPREVSVFRPRIQRIADDLLDGLADTPEMDVVEDYAYPLTISVMTELLGIPFLDRTAFRAWTNATVTDGDDSDVQTAARAHLREVLRRKQQHPGDDLLTRLLRAQNGGEPALNFEELVSMTYLLLIAGHESTTNLIANTTVALLEHRRHCAADVTIEQVVDESLRYEPPLMLSTGRFTTRPVTIGGTHIPGDGELILLAYAAAERDPADFSDPDVFDPARCNRQSLAFGGGQHYCLGHSLARVESAIALQSLFDRFPGMELAETPQRWRSTVTRGVRQLRVRLQSSE